MGRVSESGKDTRKGELIEISNQDRLPTNLRYVTAHVNGRIIFSGIGGRVHATNPISWNHHVRRKVARAIFHTNCRASRDVGEGNLLKVK